MQQQEIISPTSTLSDSEILIPNDTSSSSLDHEVRLSNAQHGASGVSTNNIGGGVGGNSNLDRDMTEDEVAIMVKNALRKARRAMNNSSPLDSSNDNSPTNNNNNNNNIESLPSPISDEIDFDALSPREPTTTAYETSSTDVAVLKQQPDMIAKRIEQEIQSARAFAERKYNDNSANNMIDNNGIGTDAMGPPPSSSTPENSKQRAREKRRAARRSPTNISSPTQNSKDAHVNPTPVKTPGKEMYDAILQVSPAGKQVVSSPQPKFTTNDLGKDASSSVVDVASEGNKDGRDSGTSPNNNKKGSLSNDPDEEFEQKKEGGSDLMIVADTDKNDEKDYIEDATTDQLQNALSQGPNTNNTNKPPQDKQPSPQQQHRQVLFRHPYPLPPPPPKPRSDSLIIEENCPPNKQINIKWVNPDVDLQALIEAAGEEYNLVRRSNACGAIKVLASKDSNKPKLCRTTGLLNVLISASYDDAVDSDALDARTRAVSTLLYLSEPKDNRLIIAKHNNCSVLECLVKVIKEDTGEARWRATSALATLAKTPSNRGIMGNVDELCSVLANLMVFGVQCKEEDEDNKKENEEDGVEGTDSRTEDDSTLQNTDSMTQRGSYESGTYDEEDGPMLTNTFSGTFTEGSTFSEDMTFDQSAYDSDTLDGSKEGDDDDDDDDMGSDQEDDNQSHNDRSHNGDDHTMDEENSVQEEEGVEMQISSLKKLNIENASDFLAKSQLSACATLTHLTKYCANAPSLCNNEDLLNNIIFLAGILDNPLHTRCIEMLCNFTRFPSNNTKLANMPSCTDMLLLTGKSKNAEDRMWSIRTIQNLCSDASSKVGLATGAMLSLLSTAAMRKDYEEQYAAVGALMNLSTEPGSIVPLTNTKTVVATLVHLAHSPNTPGAVRKIACDSLATIGLWLQTLASAGTVPEEIPFSPLPTHSATGWLRWDN